MYLHCIVFQNIKTYSFHLGDLHHGLAARGLVPTAIKEDIWRPSEEEFHRMLFNNDEFKNLIPSETFIAGRNPYALMPHNFEDIWKTIIPYVSGNKDFSEWEALSVFRQDPCKLGVRVDMHFYGRTKDQLVLHVANVLRYLASGQSFTDPQIRIFFTITIPEHFSTEDLEKFAGQCGWKPGAFAGIDSMFLAETNWRYGMELMLGSKV